MDTFKQRISESHHWLVYGLNIKLVYERSDLIGDRIPDVIIAAAHIPELSGIKVTASKNPE